MNRLIDADALWRDITTAFDDCEDILEIIEKQPTIEPRMRGKWVNRRMSGKTCSICGYDYDCKGTDSENFCPNCGADMRGEQNGQ